MPNGVNSIAPRTPTKQTKNIISPKEYVESLHQNFKSQLIYGKNNILVKKVSIFAFEIKFFLQRMKIFYFKFLFKERQINKWLFVIAFRFRIFNFKMDAKRALEFRS